jgi:hypothetical protein
MMGAPLSQLQVLSQLDRRSGVANDSQAAFNGDVPDVGIASGYRSSAAR